MAPGGRIFRRNHVLLRIFGDSGALPGTVLSMKVSFCLGWAHSRSSDFSMQCLLCFWLFLLLRAIKRAIDGSEVNDDRSDSEQSGGEHDKKD